MDTKLTQGLEGQSPEEIIDELKKEVETLKKKNEADKYFYEMQIRRYQNKITTIENIISL
jgi:hypothetical protein